LSPGVSPSMSAHSCAQVPVPDEYSYTRTWPGS
jgi:hypothetical protein